MATLTKAALARRVLAGKPATVAMAGLKQVPIRNGLEQLLLPASKSIESRVLSANYIEHDSFLTVLCITIRSKCIDIDNLSEIDNCKKLDLIDVLYKNGYIAWDKKTIVGEIENDNRMVRTLGGPCQYLREWIKMGLENALHGRRVWDDN